jgi:hypothetical protein
VSSPPLQVAIDTDKTCTWYFPCDFPTLHLQCAEPLVFNRHSGQCVLDSVAPCSNEIIEEVTCPRGPNNEPLSGLFPGSQCFEFLMCVNSEQHGEVLRCAQGQRFVPNADPTQSGSCQVDATCVQPETRATVEIRTAPNKSIRNPRMIRF